MWISSFDTALPHRCGDNLSALDHCLETATDLRGILIAFDLSR
jgi:hypothetical protein